MAFVLKGCLTLYSIRYTCVESTGIRSEVNAVLCCPAGLCRAVELAQKSVMPVTNSGAEPENTVQAAGSVARGSRVRVGRSWLNVGRLESIRATAPPIDLVVACPIRRSPREKCRGANVFKTKGIAPVVIMLECLTLRARIANSSTFGTTALNCKSSGVTLSRCQHRLCEGACGVSATNVMTNSAAPTNLD